MQPSRPSKKFFAKARPHGDRICGVFSLPGYEPDRVRENGRVKLFDKEDEAELAAARLMIFMANERIENMRDLDNHIRPLRPDEFCEQVASLGMSPVGFGQVFSIRNIDGWLSGQRRIPHWVRVMLALMQTPENRQKIADINSMEG